MELRPLPDDYEPRTVDLLDAEIPTDMGMSDVARGTSYTFLKTCLTGSFECKPC